MNMDDVLLSTRMRLAKDSNTPSDVLASLAQDSFWSVRGQVAKNPSTPPDALVVLSQDIDFCTRCEVACNPSTPYGVWIQTAVWIHEIDVSVSNRTLP